MTPPTELVRWFNETGISDVGLVGGKNASLGEMYRELTDRGVQVPNGFATTAAAYRLFLERGKLDSLIRDELGALDIGNLDQLRERAERIRAAIVAAPLPEELSAAIRSAYEKLSGNSGDPAAVAVRSSATAEDLPDASFAGQQETFLNMRGAEAVLDACRHCYASLFRERAISYRVDRGFDHMDVALSVGIQQMVRSDLASSGVMFTIDTETGFRDVVLINAAYGLGENVVQGSVNPDEFCIFKPTLLDGHRPILRRILGAKENKLVCEESGGRTVRNIPVPPEDRARFALSDDDALQLARWACLIEEHYSKRRGQPTPMDVEFAKDGVTGELFIVQARPETVQSRRDVTSVESYHLRQRGKVLASGRSIGDRIAAGPVRLIDSPQHLSEFQKGEILVTDKTDPDWEPIMKNAAAIVTNRGGRTCHAAIVSRELGVPAIVGTENATAQLRNGQPVTVSCAEGDTGFVYDGKLEFEVKHTDLSALGRPRTQIMLNVGNPDEAFALSFLPNDGVGLAREEFIVTSTIKAHPQALLGFAALPEGPDKEELRKLTAGYDDMAEYFVDRLAQGAAMIAAAFYPKDVILRLSDFKSNEYANLVGGSSFEPKEENPMIGFRGASRYYHPSYRDCFGLECRALQRVRDEMGLRNLKVMIPFCRTPDEARRVQAEMAKSGLERGKNGLEIYMMCEIPSNVVLAEEFIPLVDGFSIGSNDLTQLLLGVDRDSEILAPLFDERNPAVMRMIAQVIAACRSHGCRIGICGQAPSDFPEFARFLVKEGIDSISLNPDTLLRTTADILRQEAEAGS